MMSILDLEELKQMRHPMMLIRIPQELDVPVTRRVMQIIDSHAMRRLNDVSQLGLVSLVYPGARHTRFEHSLGVYRLALLALEHMLSDLRFSEVVTERDAKVFLLAALLHDIGHWPMCHPIEDLRLPQVERHEVLARRLLCHGELADLIESQWQVDPAEVADLLAPPKSQTFDAQQGTPLTESRKILRSLLNGPIDIDKLDYLQRDSHHAGVPYGKNFDLLRLLGSLCVAEDGSEIAITAKGKTAAEMLVFARYVMFSEVYWHHAVRSATAMLQRLVYVHQSRLDPSNWLEWSETKMQVELTNLAIQDSNHADLAHGLFGSKRQLYKRLLGFNYVENSQAHRVLARRSYDDLIRCSHGFTERLNRLCPNANLGPSDVLIDAPPPKLEVQFRLSVRLGNGNYQSLASLSPVVRALALEQFDDYVKRVHVFIHPEKRKFVQLSEQLMASELVNAACEA